MAVRLAAVGASHLWESAVPAVLDIDQQPATKPGRPAGAGTAGAGPAVSTLADVVDAAWGVLLARPAGNGHSISHSHSDGHRIRRNEEPELRCPARLRTFQRWSYRPRLPAEQMIAVLDTDAEFRAAVAARSSEEVCGAEGWLWLTRPDGWEQQLASANSGTADTATDRVVAAAAAAVEQAARRNETVTKRHRRRRAAMRRTERAAVDARRQLDEARNARVQAEIAVADARTVETEACGSHRRRIGAAAAAAAAETAARTGRDTAAAELRTARAALEAARPALPPVPDPSPTSTSVPARRRSPPAARTPAADLLIVDGYNLAFRLWAAPDNDVVELRQLRDCVLRCLTEYAASRRIGVKLVWDGTREQCTSSPAFRRAGGVGTVEVRFSRNGRTADDVIALICAGRPSAGKVIVATDDNALAGRVRRHNASVWSQQKLVAALRDGGILHTGRNGVQ